MQRKLFYRKTRAKAVTRAIKFAFFNNKWPEENGVAFSWSRMDPDL